MINKKLLKLESFKTRSKLVFRRHPSAKSNQISGWWFAREIVCPDQLAAVTVEQQLTKGGKKRDKTIESR